MYKVIVIGGGASGMITAISSARLGKDVIIFEKNEKLGKKLFITGKGRCNITNACDNDVFMKKVVSNPRFLYSAINNFNNYDVINFFNELGLKTKVERGERVFPESDKSSDVIKALENELRRLKVKIEYNKEVKNILIENGVCKGVELKNGKKFYSDSVVVATGGLSYKTTGSTGDGYRFAKNMGHTIVDTSPSLVPFNIKESFVKDLQGLSLKNVELTICVNRKKVYEDFGELLFTHFGISGPLVLSASAYIQEYLKYKDIQAFIDLKPALSEELLDIRILRDFEMYHNKRFKNALDSLFPSKLIPVMVSLSGIDKDKRVNEISKAERQQFISLIKNFKLTVLGFRSYNEAIITKGGINIKEINPTTMESKVIKKVFFVGEVLDLDALTGGFNLQIAWSTGYTAGLYC